MWPVTVVKCELFDIAGVRRVCYRRRGPLHINDDLSISVSFTTIVKTVKDSKIIAEIML